MSAAAEWLYARDVAADLDLTRQHAARMLRRLPGAQLMYRTEAGRERWRISRAAYDAWRADQRRVS